MRNIVNAFTGIETIVMARSKEGIGSVRLLVPISGMFTCKISNDKQRERIRRGVTSFFLSAEAPSLHRRHETIKTTHAIGYTKQSRNPLRENPTRRVYL